MILLLMSIFFSLLGFHGYCSFYGVVNVSLVHRSFRLYSCFWTAIQVTYVRSKWAYSLLHLWSVKNIPCVFIVASLERTLGHSSLLGRGVLASFKSGVGGRSQMWQCPIVQQ
ncbi:hypothetical protein GDO78_019868 [Eleutherodactylus coqui]|uniref:Uncharacterized protein n=1 Tax=Eleutherodactylus coqui TaxID=57060 RepID=A0A8J6ECF6_ELECQ|nr:hypothetical protein GDO78_019868 [Eleutherodactylus coqui]